MWYNPGLKKKTSVAKKKTEKKKNSFAKKKKGAAASEGIEQIIQLEVAHLASIRPNMYVW